MERNNPKSEIPEVKRARIEALLNAHEQAFERYLRSPEFTPCNLKLPPEAIRAFIPRRVLELAREPESVEINPTLMNGEELIFEIDERMPQAASQATDKVHFLTAAMIASLERKVLLMGSYEKNSVWDSQGITISFYQNLESLAKRLGFQYISGVNKEDNIAFFLTKLGRKKLIEAPRKVQEAVVGKEFLGTIESYETYKEL